MGSAQMRLVVTGLSEGVPNHPLQSRPAPSVYALAVKTNGVLGMGVDRSRSRIAPATKASLLSNACGGFPPPKIASEALLTDLSRGLIRDNHVRNFEDKSRDLEKIIGSQAGLVCGLSVQ